MKKKEILHVSIQDEQAKNDHHTHKVCEDAVKNKDQLKSNAKIRRASTSSLTEWVALTKIQNL